MYQIKSTKRFAIVTCAVALVVLQVGPADAATAGTASVALYGQMQFREAPPSLEIGAFQSDQYIRVIPEQQGFTLTEDLKANGGTPGTYASSADLVLTTVPAGTVVNSWLLHADRSGGTSAITRTGTVTFDADILGIIVLSQTLDARDFLGASGTAYPTGSATRGLEWSNGDSVVVDEAGRTITASFTFAESADEVRVVTGLPEMITVDVAGPVVESGTQSPGFTAASTWYNAYASPNYYGCDVNNQFWTWTGAATNDASIDHYELRQELWYQTTNQYGGLQWFIAKANAWYKPNRNGTNIVWYDSNPNVAGPQAPAKLSINDIRLDGYRLYVDYHAKFYDNHWYGDDMKAERLYNKGSCIYSY